MNLISFLEASKKNTTFFSSPHLVYLTHRYRLKKNLYLLNKLKNMKGLFIILA